MNVKQACEDFLVHCRSGKNLSPHTLRAYRIDLTEFERFTNPDLDVTAVTRQHLRRYLTHLFETRKLKATSVKRRMACLKVLFRWLELDEIIDITPFHRLDARIRLPRRLPRALSRDDIQRLRRAALGLIDLEGKITPTKIMRAAKTASFEDLTTLVVVEVLLCTATRVGELASVKVDDVDLVERVITVSGKGSRQRRVFLPDDSIVALVKAYLEVRTTLRPPEGTDAFLLTPRCCAASTQYIRKLVKRAGLAANLTRPVTPHMLRHTAATQLLEHGVDIRFVQKLLGHQSIGTTEGYTSVSDASLKLTITEARKRVAGLSH